MRCTPDTERAARAFLLERWRERAAELGLSEPADLAGEVLFAVTFSQAVFGGELEGNWSNPARARRARGGVGAAPYFYVMDITGISFKEDRAEVRARYVALVAAGATSACALAHENFHFGGWPLTLTWGPAILVMFAAEARWWYLAFRRRRWHRVVRPGHVLAVPTEDGPVYITARERPVSVTRDTNSVSIRNQCADEDTKRTR